MTASGATSWSVSQVANAKPHERKTGAVCNMVFLKMDMRECRAWAGAADGASTRLLAHESKDKYQLRFLDLNQAGCAAVCNPVHLACSVGTACFPVDGTDAEALMRCADAAMYRDKARRKEESTGSSAAPAQSKCEEGSMQNSPIKPPIKPKRKLWRASL
jgi:hypothetical protein